ncbi:putative F420-dependent oxidoreductase [Nocardiopsis mwathae]|uniref:Putative F420-dependent oxidoreductase n=1 Tax=Nocardiopsis mwathae TaxID=1472723 RepID=A0A7X0D6D9_9ACTN|nr:TIGR03621 family F420-dependent LLM class oxidoreductase [Nocardiopsis mwathae]MBB6172641.1 putative F420-dependent oxidoreductase [Nocardiopsis mwathae]
MRNFRFGVNFGRLKVEDWAAFCRSSEDLGFDTVLAPDHLYSAAPFAMLATAAAVTTRLRVGTLVINSEFWNPHMLAREAATVDLLSGGRLELGLGCGHMKWEFDTAGMEWRPHAERVARLERSVEELDRLFSADGGERPRPLQAPRPPLLIGAHGERTLAVAARHADIVGYGGLTQIPGRKMGTFRVADTEETLRRVEFVAEQAGPRADDIESNVLVQAVHITDDAERTADELARTLDTPGARTAAEILDSPYALVGTVEEIARELIANRERFGFSYIATHGPHRDTLAQVIPIVRELTGETAPT